LTSAQQDMQIAIDFPLGKLIFASITNAAEDAQETSSIFYFKMPI
jgi:hypothetical protein